MREPQRKKIETNAPQPGLNSAFAALDLAGLPDAPAIEKTATPAPERPRKLGRVILRRETAHRGGKTVIVVHDFPTHLTLGELERFAKKLRGGCGCGGTLKGREIEIQGDQAARIRTLLEEEGFQVAGVR